MAKNKSTLGKILAFTTTVAAIGGACYIFRDKIKQSSIYKAAADKCSDLWSKWNDNEFEDEDDFFLEDEDETFDNVFTDEEKKNREYTSITINPKEEETIEESIPTISLTEEKVEAEEITAEPEVAEAPVTDIAEEVTAYENEGLSDVSEDPDVLEEQDQLDF